MNIEENYKKKNNKLHIFSNIIKSNSLSCPNCGTIHNNNYIGYKINNKKYPKEINEKKGNTLNSNYWNWDEIHCCENCKKEYWFNNGISINYTNKKEIYFI